MNIQNHELHLTRVSPDLAAWAEFPDSYADRFSEELNRRLPEILEAGVWSLEDRLKEPVIEVYLMSDRSLQICQSVPGGLDPIAVYVPFGQWSLPEGLIDKLRELFGGEGGAIH